MSMNVATAIALVNQIIYRPGWVIEAVDHTNRFEGAIQVCIGYPSRNSNRDQADAGYPEKIDTRAIFPVVVGECEDQTALYRLVIDRIIEIEVHEAREFFRIAPTDWAPFHPHRADGMRRWGTPDADLMFGIA